VQAATGFVQYAGRAGCGATGNSIALRRSLLLLLLLLRLVI